MNDDREGGWTLMERRNRGERKHISGGEGDMWAKTEKRRRTIFAPLLPAPMRRFTCDAGGGGGGERTGAKASR